MPNRDLIDWAQKDDAAYVSEAEMQIWLSAFASNNPKAPAHVEADRASDEATRRGKPWLYQRAWNAAYASAGHRPTERNRIDALPPEDRPGAGPIRVVVYPDPKGKGVIAQALARDVWAKRSSVDEAVTVLDVLLDRDDTPWPPQFRFTTLFESVEPGARIRSLNFEIAVVQ